MPALLLFCFLSVSCEEKRAKIGSAPPMILDDAQVACCDGRIHPAPPPTNEYYDERSVKMIEPKEHKVTAALSYQWDVMWGECLMRAYKLKVYSPYDTAYDSFVVDPGMYSGEGIRVEKNDELHTMKMAQVIRWGIDSDSMFRTLFTMTADTTGKITISRNETPFVRNRY